MKKLLILLSLIPALAFGQKYTIKTDSVFFGKAANPYLLNAQTIRNYPLQNQSILLSHSIGFGFLNAGNLSFCDMIARHCGVKLTNLSVNSTAIRYANKTFAINKPGLNLAPLIVGAPDFSDMRGTTTLQAVRYQASMAGNRAIAAYQWLSTINFVYSGSGTLNANVTYSTPSGWSGAAASVLTDFGAHSLWYQANDPNNAGATAAVKTSVTANETATMTLVQGTSVVIGTWATDSVTNHWSRIQYYVDGVSKGIYNPNQKDYSTNLDGGTTSGVMNDAIVITGLSDSTHTVQLKFLDAGLKTQIDYIGTMISAKSSLSCPIYRMDLFHMGNDPSLGYNLPGGTTTQLIVDTCSNMVYNNLLATFPGYRVVRIRTNQYYDPTIAAQVAAGDEVHPTILGDQKITLALKDSISTTPIIGSTSIPTQTFISSVANIRSFLYPVGAGDGYINVGHDLGTGNSMFLAGHYVSAASSSNYGSLGVIGNAASAFIWPNGGASFGGANAPPTNGIDVLGNGNFRATTTFSTATAGTLNTTVTANLTGYTLKAQSFIGGAVAGFLMQPTGGNTRMSLLVAPSGTSTIGDIWLNATSDYNTNYNFLQFGYNAGNLAWGLNNLVGGTSSHAKIFVDASGTGTLATANIVFNTDGSTATQGQLTTLAGTTTKASLIIPTGAAMTSPTEGAFYKDASHLYGYINGVYRQLDQQTTGNPTTSASNDLTAQTAAGNITTFTVGASTATFNVNVYINVTAVTTDVIQAQITYTDENNTAQTVSLGSLSTITNSTYSPTTIRAKNATVITLKTNLTTGVGSITFDAGGCITKMY